MQSIWNQSCPIGTRPALQEDIKADVAVIGAGMAGILTAYLLQKEGKRVVILEADSICSGQTGHTTAKITCQHSAIYHRLCREFGETTAGLYAQANQQAVYDYRSLIEHRGISCDFCELPALLYTTLSGEELEREHQAALALGISSGLVRETALPFPVTRALRFDGQAQFHPLRFVSALISELSIYERSPVCEVENTLVSTEQGSVQAEHIVFACHYPFVNVPGYFFLRMHQERSYVLALKHAQSLDGMYYGIDPGGHSLRQSGNYLLLGGQNHRTGENSTGGCYDRLRTTAKKLWRDCVEISHWSAQDCMTLDGIPYIGRFSSSHPNWYVATGFGKWGMTSSMAAARLLRDLVMGLDNPYEKLFSPGRFSLSASAKNMLKDGYQAVKGLSREIFSPPKEMLDTLEPGHGGIVSFNGHKAGVYKEEDGTVHVVSARCPHLGCQLEFNPDEKTFDCPCHGSRFDFHGNQIDGPAQKGIRP